MSDRTAYQRRSLWADAGKLGLGGTSYQVRLNTCDKTNAEIFKNKSSENEINEIKVKYLKNKGNVFNKLLGNEVGMAYFCPSCKSLLGITNRFDPV
jgi:hypothetical protein